MTQLKTQALAYRVWAYAQPLGWNCTMQEVASALGESLMKVSAVCRSMGWNSRMRTESNGARHEANYVSSSAYPSEINSLLREQVRASSVSQGVQEAGE